MAGGSDASFGFSGTNAHLILEEAPPREQPKPGIERPLHLLTVSARSETALRILTERYAEELVNGTADLGDICYTANAGRAQLEERAVYAGATRDEMHEGVLCAAPLARGKQERRSGGGIPVSRPRRAVRGDGEGSV